MIGDIVKVVVDRPLGSYHPKHQDLFYPVNYGFIEGILDIKNSFVIGDMGKMRL